MRRLTLLGLVLGLTGCQTPTPRPPSYSYDPVRTAKFVEPAEHKLIELVLQIVVVSLLRSALR